VTDENDDAADPNSEANASQAAAAFNIGAEPAPENIRAELTSGANTEKFITTVQSLTARDDHADGVITGDTPRVPLHETRDRMVQCDLAHRPNITLGCSGEPL